MIITIDGPSGAGKSTVAKILADRLGYEYLDTGAMYRAISLYLLKKNIDIGNEEELNKFLHSQEFTDDFELEIKGPKVYINGKDVSDEIRSAIINDTVSKVSSYEPVREILIKMQREIAKDKNIILDGRDTGSVVFPNADFKIYLTATVEERAKRRYEQRPDRPYEEILESIKTRDYKDMNRDISPLKVPENSVLVDSTNINLEQTVDKIISLLGDRQDAL